MNIRQTKIFSFVAIAGFLLASCGGSKKVVSAERNDLKGNWTLSNITYDGLSANDKVNITLLDEGTDACLKGSTWKFPNNGNGSYTINSTTGNCTPGERDIVWSYRQESDATIFQFKKITGGVKPKNITDGYRFKVISADDNAMQLQSTVTFEGKPLYINYLFSKM